MNYIYDILLNFNRQLYDFFEWDLNDNIIHIRKIPVYKINSKILLTFRDYRVKLNDDFLEKIKRKTEIFTNKDVDTLEYACLFTDGSSVIAMKFDHNGISCGKSSLLVDEDVDVLDISNRLSEVIISCEKVEEDKYIPLKTRKEQRMIRFINEELKKSQKQKAIEKLGYLYFDCFGETEESIERIICQIQKKLLYGEFNTIQKLYDFFKLTSVQK